MIRGIRLLFFFGICNHLGCKASPTASDAGRPTFNVHLLELCIEECKKNGYCCGNRLTGEVPGSGWNALSCANGCELAYYSESVSQCKDSCTEGNSASCEYIHPDIVKPFDKCQVCQEGCDQATTTEECAVGCDLASEISGYYLKPGECKDDETWGFNNDPTKNCADWIGQHPGGRNSRRRCKKTDPATGRKVYDHCPVACRCARKTCAYCGAKCYDDENFRYEDDPEKDCKWVKKGKKARCKLDGVEAACPKACGTIRKTGNVCGEYGNDGDQFEMCVKINKNVSKWMTVGCIKRRRLDIGRPGYHPANMVADDGTHGWSYYRRAFDLIHDTPVEEIGFGQWTRGASDNMEVCGRHPHSFVCELEAPSDEQMRGELKNCGTQDLDLLEQCTYDCCGKENKCELAGGSNIEGGMGYWMYTLETPHVKWMGPAAVNHWYRSISGTFLTSGPNPCTKLGGAVRISNAVVMPNDQVQFQVDEETGRVNGFLGYMVSKTPIGKRGPEDDANYWTIFLDAENYSGPIYYISAWFWDSIASWSPKSIGWGHPNVLIDYAIEGFEGSIGGLELRDESGSKWIRTNKIAFPRDEVDGERGHASTLSTGHSRYDFDWAADAMENMLAGVGSEETQSIAHILEMSQTMRTKPQCWTQFESWGDGPWAITVSDDTSVPKFAGFGVGEILPEDENREIQETNEASCFTRLLMDKTKVNCDTEFCQVTEYVEVDKNDHDKGEPIKSKKMPPLIKKILDSVDFEPTRQNDGRYLGPPQETEKACFDQPGPADPRLYCTRLSSGTWVGFKWYRFIDQPELNQVFASIADSEERKKVKCYMQERIERLHKAVAKAKTTGTSVPRWFQPPQTKSELPEKLVSIDPAYLVTPPDGFEFGFVPIPVWERNREHPENCDVFLGDYTSEPDPFPDGYYDGYAKTDGEYFNQQCPANLESNGNFTFPGRIFPYPHKDYTKVREPYDVPLKEDVGSVLDSEPTVCGLDSDWSR